MPNQEQYDVPVLEIRSFQIWLSSIIRKRPEYGRFILHYDHGKQFWNNLKANSENKVQKTWLLSDRKNMESILAVHDKTTGFMTYFAKSRQAKPEILLEQILMKYL